MLCSAALALIGCRARVETRPDAGNERSADSSSRWLVAELEREPTRITLAELSSRDRGTRRSVARALARAPSDVSRDLLRRAIADEDPEVVSWAAFGLGRLCATEPAEPILRTLVGRIATLLLDTETTQTSDSGSAFDPWYALADAIGHCPVSDAERVLRSWLRSGKRHARLAALGLDAYVRQTRTLDDVSIVALLDSVEKERGLAVAFLPISRLPKIDTLVARRLLALAPRVLEMEGEEKRFLLRALPLAGAAAIPLLERVALDDGRYQLLERVEALRAMAKLDGDGQRVLASLVHRVIPSDSLTSEAVLLGPRWQVISELMSQLKDVPNSVHARLLGLANLDVPDRAVPAVVRRMSFLRCHAAALISSQETALSMIRRCDLSHEQRYQKLAELSVLTRRASAQTQAASLEALATDSDAVVRMAALERLTQFDVPVAKELKLIRRALVDDSMGVVAKAAQWLTQSAVEPALAKRATVELTAALEQALSKPWPPDAVEVKLNLIDAAAALGLLTTKAELQKACGDAVPSVRKHAERALQTLGEPKQRCEPPRPRPIPKEAEHLETRIRTVRLQTDVGTLDLELEPNFAPVAVTRILDLIRSGFYDGMVVHRVVPGFVVQMGDRGTDGFAGAGLPPLPSELSPEPFAVRDVGMALSGPDSGSSQFFVTLGPYPQLGGDYTRIGRAGPGWEKLAEGDAIQKAEVLP